MESGRPVRKEAGAEVGPPLTISRTVVVCPSRPAKAATPPSVKPAPIAAATTSWAARLRMPESIEPRYNQAAVGRSWSGRCARVKPRPVSGMHIEMAVAVAQRRQARRLASELKDAVARHRLLTFASAVSFGALVALVPLTLLGLGVLGALGQASVWKNSIAPTIRHHVTPPVFDGIDYSVKRILASDKGSLIALASALVLWHMTAAVTTVMETLNRIHDVEDRRPWWRKLLVALGLAGAIVGCSICPVLVVSVRPHGGSGAVHFVLA